MSPSCSIVIRCYNEEKHIGKLLYGLQNQNHPHSEIIVVDSGSTDSTLSIVKRFPVKLINISSRDFSFGRSLNLGCAAASTEYIVFASAHVFPVYKDWIAALISPFSDPRIGLVYGKQRGGETTKCSENQVFAKWFPEKSISSQNNPFCNNANAAIRKELWEQNPYDEELTGLEDIDWANKILKKGYRIAYNSHAVVIHLHDESYRQIFNRYRREALAFKYIFPNETFQLIDFIRLYLSNTVSDYRIALINRLDVKSIYEILLFRLMQFWGTYRGFRERGAITSQLKKTFYYPNNRMYDSNYEELHPIDPQMIDYQSSGRSYRENR